jgi:hypothetical protein
LRGHLRSAVKLSVGSNLLGVAQRELHGRKVAVAIGFAVPRSRKVERCRPVDAVVEALEGRLVLQREVKEKRQLWILGASRQG